MKPIINPDKEFVKSLRQRIKENDGYCVCRVSRTADTKCPCREFRETGDCCCGLYIHDPGETDAEPE